MGNNLKGNYQNLILGIFITFILLLYIVPLNGWIMDLLLVLNLSLSLLILFVVLSIEQSSHFTSFPTLLLMVTLLRLGLNVASTRLILSRSGQDGLGAAGSIIAGFGTFVAGNQTLVGLVIFAIILVVHYFVISKGADRISEVTARFVLDGLPGKQMGVDRELACGAITEKEAHKRKDEIYGESRFFSAMDGVMKFVKGDALASLLITMINIFGGLALGVFVYHLPLTRALHLFTKLTIGDGLVSAIPALLNALSAGILLTRVSGRDLPGREMEAQLFSSPVPLLYTGVVLAALAMTPLPKFPLLAGSAILMALGYSVYKAQQPARKRDHFHQQKQHIEELTQLEPATIEIGYGLIRLVDETKGGQVGHKIMEIREKTAEELGIVIPPVTIRDNIELPSKAYRIFARAALVAEGTLYRDRLLAINPGETKAKIPGFYTTEPILGLDAYWILEKHRELAEGEGYQILPPSAVLANHFRQAALENMDKILTRQEVLQILERTKKRAPDLVREALSKNLTIAKLKSIFQELLIEQVPIHDVEAILEVSCENEDLSPMAIAEESRSRLVSSMVQKYRNGQGKIPVLAFAKETETLLCEFVKTGPSPVQDQALALLVGEKLAQTGPIPLLCRSNLRRYIRDVMGKSSLKVVVFSYREIGNMPVEKKVIVKVEELFVGQIQQEAG